MKRILSLVMIFAMLLSAVGAISVVAADETTPLQVVEDYPYVYLDYETNNPTMFETGNGVLVEKNATYTWKNGGAVGSKGCANVKIPSGLGDMKFAMPENLEIGDKYTISAWVKVNLDTFGSNTPKVHFILFGYYTTTSSPVVSSDTRWSYQEPTQTLVPNQWVKVSKTFELTSDMLGGDRILSTEKPMSVTLRVTSGTDRAKGYADVLGTEYSYDLDDFVIEPVRELPVVETPLFDDSYVTAVTYENNGVNDVNKNFVTVYSGGLSIETVATPDATTDQHGSKVLKVTKTAANSGYGNLSLGNLKFNHRYKISTSVKPTATSGTSTLHLFDMHTSSYPGVIVTDTTTGVANYPRKEVSLTNGIWNDVELYICNEAVTFDNGPSFCLMYRLWDDVAQGAVLYFDNIMIQDLGIVGNGDFESAVATNKLWRPNATTATGSHDVFSWYGIDATAEASADVRTTVEDATTTSTKSMQVTVGTTGGRVHQPVDFEHGAAHTISFWAKNPVLGDGEEQNISIKLDRNDTTPDNTKDIFSYPNDAIETVAGADWKLTNQWKKFTTTYTPSFDFVDGKTAADLLANVAPRKPYLYFDVDGNVAGTSFLLDDIVIEKVVTPPPAFPYPYAVSAAATSDTIAGLDTSFVYTFMSKTDKLESEFGSIIRLMASNDGTNYACYRQSTAIGAGSVSIPQDAAGKYFKIEILPVDEDLNYGVVTTLDLGQALVDFDINVSYPTWNVAGNEITANVIIKNNLAENAGEDLIVILAIYSENNTLIDTASQSVTLTGSFNNTSSPVVLSGVVNGLEDLTAHHAKVFVWGGSALANAGDSIWKVAESYSPAA